MGVLSRKLALPLIATALLLIVCSVTVSAYAITTPAADAVVLVLSVGGAVVAAVVATRVKTADGTPVIVARAFIRNEKGAAIPAAAAVITLLIFLGIGAIVFSQVMSQAQTVATNTNDSQALSFITQAKDMGYTSLNLLMIAAFVLAAIVILGIVMRLGGG